MEHTCRFQSNESSGEFEARQTLHQIQLAEGLAIPPRLKLFTTAPTAFPAFPLCQTNKNRQLVVGAAVRTSPLIEDIVKATMGDLIEVADADGGGENVS